MSIPKDVCNIIIEYADDYIKLRDEIKESNIILNQINSKSLYEPLINHMIKNNKICQTILMM